MRALCGVVLLLAGCNSLLGVHDFVRRDASGGDDGAPTDVQDGDVVDTIGTDVALDAALLMVAAQEAYVKPSIPQVDTFFGESVALSADGSRMAVGTRQVGSSAGGVWVFSRSGTTWTQEQFITPTNANGGDEFGDSIALSDDGSRLAVGASGEASANQATPADNSAIISGAAYVFSRSGTAWTQEAYLKASNIQSGDRFGFAISLAGDGATLAAGAIYEDSGTTGVNTTPNEASSESGAVYVYTRSGVAWSQQAYLKASTNASNSRLGEKVSLSANGNTLAAAAPGEGGSGAVLVFSRSGSVWSEIAHVKAMHVPASGAFGMALALSADGMTLAVGDPVEASNATGVNGNALDLSAFNAGAAYVFARSGNTFSQQAYVKSLTTNASELFGNALGISGNGSFLVTSSWNEDGFKGAAFTYTRSGTTWSPQLPLAADNAEAGDEFSRAIAVSADGSTLAITATREDANRGAVYVFDVP